jgi:hypothetical protein
MMSAAYAEFQHWLQNVKTFERLAKAIAKGGMNWLLLVGVAIVLLAVLLATAPHIANLLQSFGLWR